jgi:hypothetical protein
VTSAEAGATPTAGSFASLAGDRGKASREGRVAASVEAGAARTEGPSVSPPQATEARPLGSEAFPPQGRRQPPGRGLSWKVAKGGRRRSGTRRPHA